VAESAAADFTVLRCRGARLESDRELYIPRSWTDPSDRCQAAGLNPDTAFATKPQLAGRLITRFLDSGPHAPWAAADEVYGGNPTLRAALEERATGYVLAMALTYEVTTGAGKFRADTLASKLPERAWQKLSAGAGAKGHRLYARAHIDLPSAASGHRHLLIRRKRCFRHRTS
jgi:SRSO17 transposase